jgi:SAM-dependent methyltransferase
MKRAFLEFLCCPECRADLRLSPGKTDGEEILEGTLSCLSCPGEWPVSGGIPRFGAAVLPPDAARTVRNFGVQWRKFSWLDPAYEEQFLDWIRPVERGFFSGKAVVDAGCGKGRHIVLARRFGARAVVGFDLSDAVEVAYEHTRGMPEVHVAQADIHKPPLKASFDYAYSLGVLHHLPVPEEGFRAVTRLLKPGGAVSAWVNGWILCCVNPFRLGVTSRLGLLGQRAVSLALTAGVLWPLVKLVYGPLHRAAPELAQRLFYGRYLSYIERFSFKDLRAIVFDHLSPSIAHYVRRSDFERWFASSGLKGVRIEHHNGNSWRGFASRP